MIKLTAHEIEQDIAGFQKRISSAQNKLDRLPVGRLPYPEHKKREQQRRQLEDDIRHVKKMAGWATEVLGEHA